MNVGLDRSASNAGRDTGLATFVDRLGMIDLWRRAHPHDRQYSYFSGAHTTFSRLDYFFAPAGTLPDTWEVEYKARRLSDLSPLWLRCGRGPHTRHASWQLNSWELRDPKVVKAILVDSQLYFAENIGTVESQVMIWEVYKTVARNSIQNTIARKRKKERE